MAMLTCSFTYCDSYCVNKQIHRLKLEDNNTDLETQWKITGVMCKLRAILIM